MFGASKRRSAAERERHLAKPIPPPGYGVEYWDDPRYVGYGGYRYDGRYRSAALKMCEIYGLNSRSKILEIGCAKGFLLYEFHILGIEVLGLDASEYAVVNGKPEIRSRLLQHSCEFLPFLDNHFDLVVAKEVVPHLGENEALILVSEIDRVGKAAFLEIQCADSEDSARLMKQWDQTHQTIKPESWWVSNLQKIGYSGDYHCRQLF